MHWLCLGTYFSVYHDRWLHMELWVEFLGRSIELFEGEVAKCENILCHDDAYAFSDSISWVVWVHHSLMLKEVLADYVQSCMHQDVGAH